MYDNFIRLGALQEERMSKKRVPESSGNYYVLYSSIIAPADGIYDLLTGDIKPNLLFVNQQKTIPDIKTVVLKKGANPIVLLYDNACETYLVVRKSGVPRPERKDVSMSWYGDEGVLPFDYSSGNNNSGLFAFESAPGLRALTFAAYGKPNVWVNGIQNEIVTGKKQSDGLTNYNVNLKNPESAGAQVVINIEYQPGYCGAAAIPRFIEQKCNEGTFNLGDWSKNDGLKAYSGGAWYRKTIQLTSSELKNRLEFDLGDLVSSAEVIVNGKSCGVRLSPPWKFDITSFAKPGENKIEVLIYNTIANNYTTVPTMYLGTIKSGLIGPVKIRMFTRD